MFFEKVHPEISVIIIFTAGAVSNNCGSVNVIGNVVPLLKY